MKKSGARGFLWAVAFGLFLASTPASAQEVRMLSSGQSLYLPIYSHEMASPVLEPTENAHASPLRLQVPDQAPTHLNGFSATRAPLAAQNFSGTNL